MLNYYTISTRADGREESNEKGQRNFTKLNYNRRGKCPEIYANEKQNTKGGKKKKEKEEGEITRNAFCFVLSRVNEISIVYFPLRSPPVIMRPKALISIKDKSVFAGG